MDNEFEDEIFEDLLDPEFWLQKFSLPEHKLLASVLQSAFEDLTKTPKSEEGIYYKRMAGLFFEEITPPKKHLFSLENICSYLRIDKIKVKKKATEVALKKSKLFITK